MEDVKYFLATVLEMKPQLLLFGIANCCFPVKGREIVSPFRARTLLLFRVCIAPSTTGYWPRLKHIDLWEYKS